MKKNTYIVVLMALLFTKYVFAEPIVKPYTFESGSKAKSAEINENFDILYNKMNSIDSDINNNAMGLWKQTDSGNISLSFGNEETYGEFQIIKDNGFSIVKTTGYGNEVWWGGFFECMRGRGTKENPKKVQWGDTIGALDMRIHYKELDEKHHFYRTAKLYAEIDGNLEKEGYVPSAWKFATLDLNSNNIDYPLKDRLIIRSSGKVGIGTYEPTTELHVAGTITEASDQRLKEDIKPINNSLEKIMLINPVSFKWKDKTKDERTHLGVIAQDIEEIFPELVFTEENAEGMKAVDYNGLIAPLIKAVKELKEEKDKEINELKEQIDILKTILCQDHPEADICQSVKN